MPANITPSPPMSPRYLVQTAPPGIGRAVSDVRALGVNPLGRAGLLGRPATSSAGARSW